MSLLDVLGLGADVLNAGYNAYTNRRDFDYQKSLQNEIFAREDNSVQRRVRDLQAAGLNPALAAGQGAGAGSVVSRSNTDSLGANLDTVQAINQIRLQKQETERQKQETDNLAKEKQILNWKEREEQINFNLKEVQMLNELGFDFDINLDNLGHTFLSFPTGQYNNIKKTNYGKRYISELNQLLTSEELLNRDANWYTADKISGMALGLLNALPINLSFLKRR